MNEQLKRFSPFWQLVGLWATAASLSFIQYQILTPWFGAQSHGMRCVSLLWPVCLFAAIIVTYSLDHYFDLKKIQEIHQQSFRTYTGIYSKIIVLFLFLFAFFMVQNSGFRQWIWTNKFLIAVTIIPTTIYFLLLKTKTIAKIPFLKEILISLAVTVAIFIPQFENNQTCSEYHQISYYFIISLWVLFFQNVLLFSYNEETFDLHQGFQNIFQHFEAKKKKFILFLIQFISFFAIFIIFFANQINLGIVLVSAIYLVISRVNIADRYYPVVRILLDLTLIFAVLI